jgi:hypothetical protein
MGCSWKYLTLRQNLTAPELSLAAIAENFANPVQIWAEADSPCLNCSVVEQNQSEFHKHDEKNV